MKEKSKEYTIHSLVKALRVIETLAEGSNEYSMQEISKKTGIHRNTVHRCLVTLEQESFVERDAKSGKYSLAVKAFEIGSAYALNMEVTHKAKKHLEALSEQHQIAAHLIINDKWDIIYIDKVEPSNAFSLSSQIGKRFPMYCTSGGKVLLAQKDKKDIIEKYSQDGFRKYTENTIDCVQTLLKELEEVSENGYALDNEEFVVGVKCVAAPVYDRRNQIVASVSASSTVSELSREKTEILIENVKKTAANLSLSLGARPDKAS